MPQTLLCFSYNLGAVILSILSCWPPVSTANFTIWLWSAVAKSKTDSSTETHANTLTESLWRDKTCLGMYLAHHDLESIVILFIIN